MYKIFIGLIVVVILGLTSYKMLVLPPSSFPKEGLVSVRYGDSLRKISRELAKQNIIRVPAVFETLVIFSGREKKIVSGDYGFDTPISVFKVAQNFITGDFGGTQIKVTLPEGLTRSQMADILSEKLPTFNALNFLAHSQSEEGYLFPSTYFFFKTTNEDDVLKALRENFKRQTAPLLKEVASSGHSLNEIIIMASLVEKESAGSVDREDVAKILWRRLREGKLLQVDAPFLFLLNKRSDQLTRNDLDIDSPYNTYRYKGLPPGPIGNPGIASILAAFEDGSTPYLFYLHGDDGIIHFAKTFEEHKKNKSLYLK